ncbi:MAG: DUF423 domain-containing protein [Pirellulales bacterium]|nr:DUF423 domain-containing protein [Pirellulales bacterium]
MRWLAIAGALSAAIGVALGAFGAHGLENWLRQSGHEAPLSQRLAWFDVAVRYQLYHALGMVAAALLAGSSAGGWYRCAGALMFAGILLFSGSLYAMTFGPDAWRKLGMVTPIGGLAFIAGWTCVALGVWRA